MGYVLHPITLDWKTSVKEALLLEHKSPAFGDTNVNRSFRDAAAPLDEKPCSPPLKVLPWRPQVYQEGVSGSEPLLAPGRVLGGYKVGLVLVCREGFPFPIPRNENLSN